MTDTLASRLQPRCSRRSIVAGGSRLVYSVPLITASLRLADQLADARTAISRDTGDSDSTRQNQSPVAVAGDDLSVVDDDGDGFASVTLDGSSSGDPDGTIASFAWTLGNEVVSRDATATVNLPVGRHRLKLKVTDDNGASGQASVIVEVVGGTSQEEPTKATHLPVAPHDLKAVQKKQEVALTWLVDGDGQPPYRIYRIIDDGSDKPMDEREWTLVWEEPSQLSYRDTAVEPRIPYLYTVRSFDGVNESDNSNVAGITLQPAATDTPAPDQQQETVPSPTVAPSKTPVPTETATEEEQKQPTEPPADDGIESPTPTD